MRSSLVLNPEAKRVDAKYEDPQEFCNELRRRVIQRIAKAGAYLCSRIDANDGARWVDDERCYFFSAKLVANEGGTREQQSAMDEAKGICLLEIEEMLS